jgi:hypothetical protein
MEQSGLIMQVLFQALPAFEREVIESYVLGPNIQTADNGGVVL